MNSIINNRLLAFALSVGGSFLFALPLTALPLDFEQAEYTVSPGDEITLQTSFGEPVPDGLGAYYIRMNFPSGLFELDEDDIQVPPELDFGFFEPDPDRSVSNSSAEIRGFAEAGSPYTGTGFASFSVTIGINAPGGTQTIDLQIPQENSFIDGEGDAIDDDIILGGATVIVDVPAPELISPPVRDPANGNVSLSFSGLPGRTYEIQVSTDLTSWEPVDQVVADAEGEGEFVDTDAGTFDRRFYRVVDN